MYYYQNKEKKMYIEALLSGVVKQPLRRLDKQGQDYNRFCPVD